MKKIILLALLYFTNMALSQEKTIAGKGVIIFEASVPSFEEVKAKNENTSCTLNLGNGEILTSILIKNFHFKNALMEKHFNENYMESDKYPKGTFIGVIEGFNINIIGDSPKEFKLNGRLKLHGKTKKIETIAILRKTNNGLEMVCDFSINTKDFGIKIPKILSTKVAETVNINTLFLFNKPILANNP